MHRPRRCLESKNQNPSKEFSCKKPDSNPCFHSAKSSQHPARWPLSKKQDNHHRSFSRATFAASGATGAKKTADKTNSAWSTVSNSSADIEQSLTRNSSSSPKPTVP